ncbi:MAG: hypothetical protein H0X24_21340 [Ktedonobacterales bacterium]|nr:hypothetical protein [Ktedonobacterales bacterium]
MAEGQIYLCFALADRSFCEELGRALQTVGRDFSQDDPLSQTADTAIPPQLAQASICLVILSQQALGSLRMRNQTRWFANACAADANKRMWVIWREPVPQERIWRFLEPFPMIGGSADATFTSVHLIELTLQALDVAPEAIAAANEAIQLPSLPPPTAVMPQHRRRGPWPALFIALALVIAGGLVFASGILPPRKGGTLTPNTASVPTIAFATGMATPAITPPPTLARTVTPGAHLTPTVTRTRTPAQPTATSVKGAPAPPAILNAGFETPALGMGNYQYNPPGGAWAFTDSTPQAGSGIAANASAFTNANPSAPEGTQVGVLQMEGSISQVLSGFRAGVTYTLTFAVAQRGSVNTGGEDFSITLDGALIGTSKPATATYDNVTFTFTTTTGNHTLKFQGLDSAGGDNTVFIDNVRLTG